jgi:HAMP domain-containing protein
MGSLSSESKQSDTRFALFKNILKHGKLSGIWIPVRAKITVPFLIVAVTMAAVIAFVLYQIVFENIDQRFNTQLVESGKLASDWMVQEENARLANLRILSYTSGVGDALQAKDAESLRKATLGFAVGNQEDAVEFLDTQGNLVLSMRHRPGSLYLEDYVFSTGGTINYRQWSFVDQVVTGVTDVLGNKFAGIARAPWGDYFYVSGPVYSSSNKLAGVVLVGEGMSTLVHKMRQDIGSQVTIFDLNGKPIASTFASPELTSANVAAVLDNQNTSSLRRDDNLTFNGINYGEILGPWMVRKNQNLGLIGTAIPKNLLIQTSTTIRIQLAFLVGICLFLVLIMGGTIADLITRPLLGLVKASREVARGNLGVNVKPQSNDEIADLTESFNQMIASIQQSHQDLLDAYENTLEGWSRAVNLKDNDTDQHMHNVVDLTLQLAKKMGYQGDDLIQIQRGAMLHDVGKIGIPDTILKKPGLLTSEERIEMQKHPQFAYEMLYPIKYLRAALDIPTYHHEKWDGSGYPNGLKGEEIPEIARIFAIVDVWDAMTSDRVYRKAIPEEVVVKYIYDNRGTHFDPRIAGIFLAMIGKTQDFSGE